MRRFSANRLGWVCAGLSLALSPALQSQTDTTQWSAAVLDKLLAGVAPGQRLVPVGDMQILTANLQTWRNKLVGARTPNLAFDGTAPTWTGGNVHYTFDGSVSAAHQKAFLDGANEWATFANLRVIPRDTEPNYVTIQEQASLEGGQSAVGMVGGQQFLSIGPTSWNRATISAMSSVIRSGWCMSTSVQSAIHSSWCSAPTSSPARRATSWCCPTPATRALTISCPSCTTTGIRSPSTQPTTPWNRSRPISSI
jgi:hypothetical protein